MNQASFTRGNDAIKAEANSTTPAMVDPPEIEQPLPPPTPSPETFKCEKCGATFDNAGAAAEHIQNCEGTKPVIQAED